MGEVETFEIVFSEQRPYLEGQEVRGEVVLDCGQEIVMDRLDIELRGIAELKRKTKVKLTKKEKKLKVKTNKDGGRTSATDLNYNTSTREEIPFRENYLNQKVTIYKRDTSAGFMTPAGRQAFPFRIQLPYNLPSSVSGRFGSVRYYCEATLTRPWQPQQTTGKEFLVRSLTDLAAHPQALRWFKYDARAQHRVLSCLGDVLVRWRLERIGYMPHESILIRARISNYSLAAVKQTRAVLYQNMKYMDVPEQKVYDRREICRLVRPSIAVGEKDVWRDTMLIPDLPPTGLNGCTLMELWYTLSLEVIGLPPLNSSAFCSTDIIIGSAIGSPSWAEQLERAVSSDDLELAHDAIDNDYFA